MCSFTKWLNVVAAVLSAGLCGGCQSFKDNSLTGNLWQKDPTGSIYDQAHGDKYVHSPLTRTTLTPLAIVGDATVVGAALGVGCVVGTFANACQEGARNGGRISW